jgi:hypothetical protein
MLTDAIRPPGSRPIRRANARECHVACASASGTPNKPNPVKNNKLIGARGTATEGIALVAAQDANSDGHVRA